MTPLRSSGKQSLSCMKAAMYFPWGLTVSTTRVLVVGRDIAAQTADPVITVFGEQLDVVSHLGRAVIFIF